MSAIRILAAAALWVLALLLGAYAYMQANWAAGLDGRLRHPMIVCGAAFVAGHAIAWLLARCDKARFPPLGATRHGIALVVAFVAVLARSHVGPAMTIQVMQEEIPPLVGVLYPLLAFAAPLLLQLTARRIAAADQLLLFAIAYATSSAALFLGEAPVALGLSVAALLHQLGRDGSRVERPALLVFLLLLLLQFSIATKLGRNLVESMPSWQWIAAMTAIALAIGVRPRGRADWIRILAVPVAVATVIAACGVALTVWIAVAIDPRPALETRLILFRQHPNFLAPLFGFHALLALGLLFAARRYRVVPALAAALLAFATLRTDSRTGLGALLLGVLLLVALLAWRATPARARRAVLVAAAAAVALALGGLTLLVVTKHGGDWAALLPGEDRIHRSLDFRLDAWRNSLAIIQDHPWTGIGPRCFVTALEFAPDSRFFHEATSPHPHNALLYVAQSGGLPALLGFVVFTALLVVVAWRALMRRPAAGDPAALGGAIPAALLAGVAMLLAANLFDVGLALETVVPGPFFVIGGLFATLPRRAAADRARESRTIRPGPALLAACGLAVLFVQAAVQPLRARIAFQQAHLFSLDATARDDESFLVRARDAMRRAIRLDPTTPRAHQLLARWVEREEGNLEHAGAVLLELLQIAPNDAPTHSLLGNLHMRAGGFDRAAAEFARALKSGHQSVHQTSDRANLIQCLARTGFGDDAQRQLVTALTMNPQVIDKIPWTRNADGSRVLPVAGGDPPEVRLLGAVEAVYDERRRIQEDGGVVGRRYWMDTVAMFRTIGRDDRALQVLEYIERYVPVVEREIIFNQRAWIARDAGDFAGAREMMLRAAELADDQNRPWFEAHAERLGMGQTGDDTAPPPRPLGAEHEQEPAGDLMSEAPIARVILENRSRLRADAGNFAGAADARRRCLPFTEELLDRARLRLEIADLFMKAGRADRAVATLAEALRETGAKPFPIERLQVGIADTLPAQIARRANAAWQALGLPVAERRRRAWDLPDYFGSRHGPSLFRLAFYEVTAQVDQLEREADLQLLAAPEHVPAMWARFFAFDMAGRRADAELAMRQLAEYAAANWNVEAIWRAYVEAHTDDRADPESWIQAGILQLLRGNYKEAADLFESGAGLLGDDASRQADAWSWAARAHDLHRDKERARAALKHALECTPDQPQLLLREKAPR